MCSSLYIPETYSTANTFPLYNYITPNQVVPSGFTCTNTGSP